jgi:hypothetical protein
MATSYSTNLALTLQGTNDNPGTWGDITNTNLGTLLEQAISGYETQALTSGVTLTLTIPNGSSGVARNMYLEFTGNGSTVIVPSNKKLYFVYNNCTSGTITMKVAGQTGVTIPKGEKQVLVSNGTDIVSGINAISGGFSSLTIGNLSLYGSSVESTSGDLLLKCPVGEAVLVGTTSEISIGQNSKFEVYNSEGAGIAATFKNDDYVRTTVTVWNSATSNNNEFMAFGTEGTYTNRGSINYNRGAGQVAYNTTSDRRSKTIYGPVTNSGQIVDELKVYEGKMNWGTEIYPMMIADEAQKVTPYCVTGLPNAVYPDGTPKYQQMDYSALVPLLLAEIKSLRSRVAVLEAKS